VGHAYTVNSLVARHGETIEHSLWVAYRALEERAAMSRRVSRRLADRGRVESSARFERQAQVAELHADRLKRVIDEFEIGSAETTQEEATG
jgi:two-component system chemotaxis response regulator CheB